MIPSRAVDLSVVIPVFDEADNIGPLVQGLFVELDRLGRSYEVIVVNDGSLDATATKLDGLAASNPRLKVIHFTRNFGQTQAIAAGMEAAVGPIIVTIDGDRQNDPADIGPLIRRLEEGYDVVSGWRKDRQDDALRRLPSVYANRLIGWVTGVRLHDYGCTLKAYRAGIIDPRQLYGQMHRFLPIYAAMNGGRIAEMVVRHHPRTAGVSKYGLRRTFRVALDLALVQMLYRYSSRPSHMFVAVAEWMGSLGVLFLLASLLALLGSGGYALGLLLVAVVLGVGTITLLGIGVCAELIMRARFESSGAKPWSIRRTVNFAGKGEASAHTLDPANRSA